MTHTKTEGAILEGSLSKLCAVAQVDKEITVLQLLHLLSI